MNNTNFKEILYSAIEGNSDSIYCLINMYMPLFDRFSYVDGIYDEDLRQHLFEHFIKNINKFHL